MTKKVLGNDPFANNASDAEKPGETAARASAKPSARPSKRAPGKSSKAPKESKASKHSKRPQKVEEGEEEPLLIAAAPKVPVEAKEILHGESQDKPTDAPLASAPVTSEEDSAIDDIGAEAAVATDADARAEQSPSGAPSAESAVESGSIEERIRDLESQLDVLLSKTGRPRSPEAPTPAATASAETAPTAVVTEELAPARSEESDPADIVSSEYYARQWGRVALRDRAEEVDEFGLDQEFARRAEPVIDALYARWWRVETSGVENVPDEGRVILCANHAGAVPYDGLMLAAALRKEHRAKRTLRWLADDFVFHFPFMGVALNRLGAVRACQENAERLLRGSTVVGVFPEGVKGVSKSFGERYQLQRFGRGGHIKLALRTRTPIVPVAIVGSEETHPMLPTGPIAKLLNMQFLPITPTFPWLGPLGLVPLPSKWSITFLEPIPVDGYDKDSADDELLVGRLNEKVRAAIQDELSRRVRARQSAFR